MNLDALLCKVQKLARVPFSHDGFMAWHIVSMITAMFAVDSALSSAISVGGTSLPFPSSSSHVTKIKEFFKIGGVCWGEGWGKNPVSCLWQTQIIEIFFLYRKEAGNCFPVEFLLGPLAHFSWFWIGSSGKKGSCLTASFSLTPAPTSINCHFE